LSLSLQDNILIEANDRFVRYRAATEPGSGGSPVFDENWELIAVHHAAGSLRALNRVGDYEAAEGISIHAIVKAIDDLFAQSARDAHSA
jgi:V8-like Glu-specific endopeptidase